MSEAIDVFRQTLRKLPTYWETWLAILGFVFLVSAITNGAIKDAMLKSQQEQIQVIREQNDRSLADRTWLHDELRATRDALKRLERTVKTGEYP